jgi:hypothetical protein
MQSLKATILKVFRKETWRRSVRLNFFLTQGVNEIRMWGIIPPPLFYYKIEIQCFRIFLFGDGT